MIFKKALFKVYTSTHRLEKVFLQRQLYIIINDIKCIQLKKISRPISRVLYHKAYTLYGNHSSGTDVTIRLVQPTQMTRLETSCKLSLARHFYLVLLPVGFTLPHSLLNARWALTPPFHPYL